MVDREKHILVEDIVRQLADKGFRVAAQDLDRPWGGFLVIDETQVQSFASLYFGSGSDSNTIVSPSDISGKILFVAPNKRLSWQYHRRRNEHWRVLQGTVGVVTSENDDENELRLLSEGNQICLPAGTRHRLVGLDNWGIVAEIWEHTVPGNPSDEMDIVRLQDDFSRGSL